jgi:hypothetical protein
MRGPPKTGVGTGVAYLLLTVGIGGATIFQRKRAAIVKEKNLRLVSWCLTVLL